MNEKSPLETHEAGLICGVGPAVSEPKYIKRQNKLVIMFDYYKNLNMT